MTPDAAVYRVCHCVCLCVCVVTASGSLLRPRSRPKVVLRWHGDSRCIALPLSQLLFKHFWTAFATICISSIHIYIYTSIVDVLHVFHRVHLSIIRWYIIHPPAQSYIHETSARRWRKRNITHCATWHTEHTATQRSSPELSDLPPRPPRPPRSNNTMRIVYSFTTPRFMCSTFSCVCTRYGRREPHRT